MRALVLTLLFSCAAGSAAWAQGTPDLPEIGSPANAVLTLDEEDRIGRMVLRGLREQGQLETDPELNQYIQSLGNRLAAQAHDGDHSFQFFLVDDPRINAFALPGGYIGVNTGLLAATDNESELAGVLAHEIAHVTQRHIARRMQQIQRVSLVSTAAVLAAILLGVGGGSSDAVMGTLAGAQGLAAQSVVNFTRANEYEADRVGIGTLVAAGFDPQAMPDFFEEIGRRAGGTPGQVPEFLQTHPVTSSRVAESRGRAAQYETPKASDSTGYELAGARLRVLSASSPDEAVSYYRRLDEAAGGDLHLRDRYGYALALSRTGQADQAIRILRGLLKEHEDIIALHTGLGEALLADKQVGAAEEVLARANKLFPRNVPVTIAYSEALARGGEAGRAHRLLLDLLNNVPPTPEQARLIALIASQAGDAADAHYYMSEYHVLNGELPLAVAQLELALAAPDLDSVQRARFEARLAQISEYLPRNPPRESISRRAPRGESVARYQPAQR